MELDYSWLNISLVQSWMITNLLFKAGLFITVVVEHQTAVCTKSQVFSDFSSRLL